MQSFFKVTCLLYIRIDILHLCLASIANFATCALGEENVEEMVGTIREAAAVATESGGVVTTGDETAATGGVMYMDEGELELDEDEMTALEGQRLVAELFPDSGSEPDFEGFYASEPAGNPNGCQ